MEVRRSEVVAATEYRSSSSLDENMSISAYLIIRYVGLQKLDLPDTSEVETMPS